VKSAISFPEYVSETVCIGYIEDEHRVMDAILVRRPLYTRSLTGLLKFGPGVRV
jgi:hypothetical protein